jgi:peptidoglycan biosynthesis protein MviN/MurJ (putative lipid II flippase)
MGLYGMCGVSLQKIPVSFQNHCILFWMIAGIFASLYQIIPLYVYFLYKKSFQQDIYPECDPSVHKRSLTKFFIYSPSLKKFLERFIPASLTASANQINSLITLSFTSLLPHGQLTCLYMAEKIHILPYTFLGITMSTVLLPFLSSSDSVEQHNNKAREAFIFVLILTLPASLILYGLATPIIRLCFERGAFGPEEVKITASILKVYSIALPAYIMIKIMNMICFTQKYTKGPLWAMAVSCSVDIILCFSFIHKFSYLGVAWATTGAAWSSALTLIYFLRHNSLFYHMNTIRLLKFLGSLCVTALILEKVSSLYPTKNIFFIGILSLGGIIFWVILCILTQVFSIRMIKNKYVHWKRGQSD